MRHIPGIDRSQVLLLPEAVDDYVGRDNPVRFIDAFVDGLDLATAGFERATPKATGRPGYDPADLLKLYIYGYLNRVRSSRRLEAESKRNLEVIWLLRRLSPDFKTIADFRRINRAAFRQVFREFVRLCRELELFGRELVAVDGTRIKAVNSRERNFTKAKLEKALAESDERLSRYLDRLDEADGQDESGTGGGEVENIREKIAAIQGRRERFEEHRDALAASGEDQLSLTDPDSRAMHAATRVGVGYNIQIAVDAKHKLIAEQQVHSVPIRLSPTPTICRVWRRVAREADEAGMDVPQREDLSFPRSLPEFQRLFPDDAACAAYLEKARWGDGFVCPHCQTAAEPFRFTSRPGVLRCRKCRRDTGLTAGTVMERSHTSLGVWFWAAYLVASQTPGMSATQFQRQVGLSRYETAFQILHKLRAGMVRPDQDRIGSEACDHVEVDETWVGGRTRGKGRGVHHKLLVASAVEVRQRKPGTKLDKRKGGRYAGRVRLAVVPDRSAESLCGFVEGAVTSGASVITDDWSGYTSLAKRGYKHLAVAERGNSQVAEEYLPIIHLVFANLKTWLSGIHHGVSHQHLQAYLNEFTFRFNRRFCPFNAFRSLLGIAGDVTAPTYAELYSGDWEHPRCSGCG